MGAVDGSFSRDCTVLAVATVEPRPHVWLERIWESPRRIDAAVAAVMAVHRAAELAGGSRPDSYI